MSSNVVQNLIHIGLPKTGSTALQHYWSKSPVIDCVWPELDPLVKSVRDLVQRRGSPDSYSIPTLERQPSPADRLCTIYTSEALSTYAWGKTATVEQVLLARELFSQALKQNVDTAKVLIVIRSPIPWIFSLYKQYVQEGGYRTLQRFVQLEQEFIAATLSIRNLYQYWAEQYGEENIIILPYEMLNEDVNQFNQLISDELGIKYSDALIGAIPKVNVSITDKELELMRSASSWLHKLEKHSERSILSSRTARQDLLLILRTELQQRGQLSRFINRACKEPELKLNLPDNLIQVLVSDFFEFLHEYKPAFHGYLEQYYAECGLN